MNILKEQIKLSVSLSGWRSAKKLRLNKIKRFLFGTPIMATHLESCNRNSRTIFFEDFSDYDYFEILMPMLIIHKKK